MKRILFAVVLAGGAFLLAIILNCGNGGSGGSGSNSGNTLLADTGTVNLSITDPPICKNPNGKFKHIWITITRVRAHVLGDADPDRDDGRWIDLVDLRDHPMQMDLLDLDATSCLLTRLGSTSGLPSGHFQQIRVYLLSNNPKPTEPLPSQNRCSGEGFNCVVIENATPDGITEALLVGSAGQTGIKIPSAQIDHGKFLIPAGQSVDLNIDFDACRSIVEQGNGQFRLKPVVRAGEVSLNKNAISGRVIDSLTKQPIPLAIVAIEQRDPGNPLLDRIIAQKFTGPDGEFVFCPLPSGQTFDIVAVALTSQAAYNATVTLNVPVGKATGDIPLVPEPAGRVPATITGRVTTTTVSPPTPTSATSADIALSALQPTKAPGSADLLIVTVPLLDGSPQSLTTESNSNCPSGTDCAIYDLLVPSSNPKVGVFGQPYAAPFAGPVNFWINAQAFVPLTSVSNPGKVDCSPSSLPQLFDSSTALTVVDASGTLITAVTQDFTFTGCQ